MRIALVMLIISGCAASTFPDQSGLARLNQEMTQVETREQLCMHGASVKEANALAQLGPATDGFAVLDRRAVQSNYDIDTRQCRADAAFERQALAAQERKEYELEMRRQRDLNALMPTLIASRPP